MDEILHRGISEWTPEEIVKGIPKKSVGGVPHIIDRRIPEETVAEVSDQFVKRISEIF